MVSKSTFYTVLTLIAVGCLRFILDLELAPRAVWLLHWLPVRPIFRAKPVRLAGIWEQQWTGTSDKFPDTSDRFSAAEIRQLGAYCVGEFSSSGYDYRLVGRICGEFMVGRWYDVKDEYGYFGSFQLRVLNSLHLSGKWLGHSQTTLEIKHGAWEWRRSSGALD